MCARYVFFSGKAFSDDFGVAAVPDLTPRYNIAPTQVVPGVIMGPGGREFTVFQWGLVPGWAKDPTIGTKLINAKAETLAEKPSFRGAFKYRRCLIPADGFYEWKGPSGAKQPYYLTCRRHPFAFAGLWEDWETPDGYLRTCTIVTTAANRLVSEVHDRMPVILSKEEYGLWLDHSLKPAEVAPLLDPFPDTEMSMVPVGKAVGNPRVEGAGLIEPIAPTTLF